MVITKRMSQTRLSRLMYQKIKKHPTPRKLYEDSLVNWTWHVFDAAKTKAVLDDYRNSLDNGRKHC